MVRKIKKGSKREGKFGIYGVDLVIREIQDASSVSYFEKSY